LEAPVELVTELQLRVQAVPDQVYPMLQAHWLELTALPFEFVTPVQLITQADPFHNSPALQTQPVPLTTPVELVTFEQFKTQALPFQL